MPPRPMLAISALTKSPTLRRTVAGGCKRSDAQADL
jgi:hypothetical protein